MLGSLPRRVTFTEEAFMPLAGPELPPLHGQQDWCVHALAAVVNNQNRISNHGSKSAELALTPSGNLLSTCENGQLAKWEENSWQ